MPLPILGWAAVAVATATVGYLATKDDDNSLSSSDDRYEREREAKEKAKEEKKKKIRKKITTYKKEQVSQIKEKYAISIEFKSTKVKIISKDKTLQNKITNVKKETKELEESLLELEAIKNETLK